MNFQQNGDFMEKYFNILKKCAFFSGIKEDCLFKMLTCLNAKVELFDKNYTVITEGIAAKYIGIVLSGSVQAVQMDYYGNRNILSHFTVGEVFAEDFACAEVSSMPISFIANELSEIMLIDCSRVLNTCSNNCGFHKQLIFNIMKNLATKSIAFHQKMEITSKRTTKEKLMAYLLFYAKKVASNSFVIPFNRQELADYLEVDRSGLSAEISKLRAEGVLQCHKNSFKLL